MSSTGLHEAAEDLTPATREMHRALTSLIEELEAVDWYAQRVDASQDEALRAVLAHNRDEEKEHACMTLEWIRRLDPKFDTYLRRFLFRSGSIVDAEEGDEAEAPTTRTRPRAADHGLALGSLREEPQDEEVHA